MPTRLPVLLQRRKSALAGWAVNATAAMTSAPPASARPAARRCRGWRRTPALVDRCFIPPRNLVFTAKNAAFFPKIGTGLAPDAIRFRLAVAPPDQFVAFRAASMIAAALSSVLVKRCPYTPSVMVGEPCPRR